MSDFRVPRRIKKAKRTINPEFKSVVIFVISAFLAAIFAFKLYLVSLPPIKNLKEFKPNIVTKFYSQDGEVIKTFTAFTFKKVDLSDMPDDLKKAIIATEDKNFYHHPGYDLTGLIRANVANLVAGHVVQGASTITQQLARILFLSNEKTYTRKVKELVIASRIEKTIPKDKILEMYLNNVYLGSGAYGVAGAADVYFNKKLSQLTLAECALIAGLPQAPSVYSPFHDPKLAKERRNQVLKRMLTMNYITPKQYEQACKERLHLNPLPEVYTLNKAPYFCDYAMKELQALGFDDVDIAQGGYKIDTTLDYKTQQKTNTAIINEMRGWGLRRAKQQAAVFSFSPVDGKILAYAGGKDYSQSQYDRVTQAVRPPGSSFKPFIYAAAIEKGLRPNDTLEDRPLRIGDWSPRNYGGRYRGNIPAYKALMISSNVCAARLIQSTGVRAVIEMARSLGISTPLEHDYTIALGSNGVKLFEMTRAYGAFANGGFKVDPYSIQKVETSRGKIIYEAPSARMQRSINANTAAILTTMLRTVLISGTGRAANIGKPSAGKTGTTDDSKDAWFVGYTPSVVTGVWVGNDDNTTNGHVTGGTVPALIWKDVMKEATKSFGDEDFNYPQIELRGYDNTKLYGADTIKTTSKMAEDKPVAVGQNVEEDSITDEPVDSEEDAPTPQPTRNTSSQRTRTASRPATPKAAPMAPVPMASPTDMGE